MPWLRRPLLIGAGAIGTVVLMGVTAERAAAAAVLHWRPQLERSLSAVLGQPVHLGAFQGLRPWGLSLGASRISAQGQSRSSVSIGRLEVRVAPLASLRQGLLSLELRAYQTRVELRPNSNKQYWVLGPRRVGQPPPRLSVLLQLPQPAEVTVAPNGSRWRVRGDLQVQLRQRRLAVRSTLLPLRGQRSGSLALGLSGDWGRRTWQVRLGLNRLALAELGALLPTRVPQRLPGQSSGALTLNWQRGIPACHGQIQLSNLLWSTRGLPAARLRCQQQQLVLEPSPLRWGDWQGIATGRARWRGGAVLDIETLELRRGRSWIRSRGRLGRTLALDSRWQLQLGDLPGSQRLPGWVRQTPLSGRISSRGTWSQPQIGLLLQRGSDPLLGTWQASLRWRQGLLQLVDLRGHGIQASGSMPLRLGGGQGLQLGPVKLAVHVQNFALQRLKPLLGAQLEGRLQAQGSITGPLNRLRPDLQLQLDGLAAGPLRLDERWQGRWLGQDGGGGLLELTALAPAPPGHLEARLNRRWAPTQVTLWRGSGQLNLQGSPRAYRWWANNLLTDGLIVSLGQRGRQTIAGALNGRGRLSLQPLSFNGEASLERPLLLGLRLQSARLSGSYQNRSYDFKTVLQPKGSGLISGEGEGRWRGPFTLRAALRGMEGDNLRQLAELWPLWQGPSRQAPGLARDLGQLLISTLGQSVDQQLAALQRARDTAATRPRRNPLKQLQARLDADLSLSGSTLRSATLELASTGHLWTSADHSDQALASDPFQLRFKGPLRQGSGDFDLQQLPLALLTMLTPVPEGLRGTLSIQGRYRLGRRNDLALNLGLQQAQWGNTSLVLKRGSLVLAGPVVNVDLALQAGGAQNNVELAGVVPLDASSRKLELRLASRGDGLRFLTAFAEPDLTWQRGSLDLQLLLRGSVADPIANGFLRIQGGQLRVLQQTVEQLEATVVFDFQQLMVQQLSARVGQRGRISATGHLGLLEPTVSEPPLEVEVQALPFNMPRIQAVADGQLQIRGSLRAMQMGGALAINHGSINAQPGRLVASRPGKSASTPRESVSQLLLEHWDFKSPLQLIGSEVATNSSQRVVQSVPRLAALGFNDLRLQLGPDLKIQIPNAASFKTAGLLRLTGRLDPSLRARGVLRLLQGRLNLFTTSFNLDPEAPNVAIFTPALGLIPYLDIAMRTRVSDNLAATGLGRSINPSLADIESQGGFSALNQFNLVRITVSVQGPADRLGSSIRLRSTPAMPESRLIALIGGNSLAGLSGGSAGAAIATVVGQTLLSPVLGGLSDAFGQRISFALYPTYVNPNVTNSAVLQSQRLAPQLVLGSEVGVDITDRFNASVLAAPNRSDVPTQLNLSVRANDLITIQGGVDTQGAWQTQLQLFFRF